MNSRDAVVSRAIKMICEDNSLEEFQDALRKDKEARDFLVVSFDKAIQTNKEKQNGQD